MLVQDGKFTNPLLFYIIFLSNGFLQHTSKNLISHFAWGFLPLVSPFMPKNVPVAFRARALVSPRSANVRFAAGEWGGLREGTVAAPEAPLLPVAVSP